MSDLTPDQASQETARLVLQMDAAISAFGTGAEVGLQALDAASQIDSGAQNDPVNGGMPGTYTRPVERRVPRRPNKVGLAVLTALPIPTVQRCFDFGVRLGEYLHPDTVAVPMGPRLRQIAVASPEYIALHGKPQQPRELLQHRCINWRQNEGGALYAWEFAKDSEPLSVSVSGGLVYNDRETAVLAAIKGLEIALWVEHRLRPLIDACKLVPMLEDWSPPYPGFYLYYYRNRHMSVAAKVLLDAIRRASLND